MQFRLQNTGLVILVALFLGSAARSLSAHPYEARRHQALEAMDSSSAILLRAADRVMRSNDTPYPYRQESNMLYLTGIEEPGVVLLLAKRGVPVNGQRTSAVVFAPATIISQIRSQVSDPGLIVLDARELQTILARSFPELSRLYLSAPNVSFVNDWVNGRSLFLDRDERKVLESKYPNLTVKSASTFLSPLRVVKSSEEVEKIRLAIRLTGDGLGQAMKVCAPARYEYELQAALEFEMMRQGASAPAFPSIIGSGPNSLILHYETNRRKMGAGELVVMDVGAEFEGYAADITRTIPVSGSYSPEQRRMVQAVLAAQDSVIAVIRPGLPWAELDRVANRIIRESGFAGKMNHPVSHHLGIDVHDVGAWDTLRAGMVITVEPGIYISESDTAFAPPFRGNGVRIEDDVLVTETGAEVLSGALPKRPEEIEALMRR
jgi:Xaa-Pro aminopeptidase